MLDGTGQVARSESVSRSPAEAARPCGRGWGLASRSRRTRWIAGWAVLAIAATFVEAIARLGALGLQGIRTGLSTQQWLALALLLPAFCYGEGYRALQRRFAPRVVARSLAAADALHGCFAVLAAPAYALTLFGADRRSVARSWLGVVAIVGCVLWVRTLPAAWRAVIDLSVAAALSWGLVALLRCALADLIRAPTSTAGTRVG